MDFKDVELARERYNSKIKALSRKRKKIFLTTIIITLIIELLVVSPNYETISDLFPTNHFIGSIAPIIIFIFFVVIFDLVVAVAFVAIFTNNTAISSDYLAYKKAYKAFFIEKQLTSVFSDVNYYHDQGLDKGLLDSTELIYTGDIYHSNDLVIAKYKSTTFMQADVHIEEIKKEKDKDGKTTERICTVFKGRYLVFEFPKKIDYKMVISFQGYNGTYVNPRTGKGLSLIETESTTFNKRFLVYAEDGFEAFYVLNPAIIDKLEELGQKYHDALALYFSDNKLFIGLNDGNDAFEPPAPTTPIDEKAEQAKVVNDMRLITEIVDGLKLDWQ